MFRISNLFCRHSDPIIELAAKIETRIAGCFASQTEFSNHILKKNR